MTNHANELPDLFRKPDGSMIAQAAEWPLWRREFSLERSGQRAADLPRTGSLQAIAAGFFMVGARLFPGGRMSPGQIRASTMSAAAGLLQPCRKKLRVAPS